jgi:hypothetical protein
LAANNPWPAVGTTILFLRRENIGQTGVVIEDKFGSCRGGSFLVRLANQGEGVIGSAVMPFTDLYIDVNEFCLPTWMPPVSIEDNAHLHEGMLRYLVRTSASRNRRVRKESIQSLIATCWWGRLPLDGNDIWPMLAAHGVRESDRSFLIQHFEFGLDLLRNVNGRRAIKRKRMPAFSENIYLSKAQREPRYKILCHD